MAMLSRFACITLVLLCLCIGLHAQACPAIGTIVDGAVSCTDSWNDGSVCTFSCNLGYTMTGAPNTTCSAAVWSDIAPLCIANEGAIRIVLGTATKGTLEIYHAGSWGSICQDGFTDIAATLACREMGLGDVGLTHAWSHFGESPSVSVWTSDMACTGSEADLASCPNSGWLAHTCNSSMDVGVECRSSYEYRLRDGPTPNAGRLEIDVGGQWRSVCDIGFDMAAANISCNVLGYDGAYSFTPGGTFGNGTGAVHYSNLGCTGSENSLAECPHTLGDGGVCDLRSDVAVTCRGGPLRLISRYGNDSAEGMVELFHAGKWGSLSTYTFDYDDQDAGAKVICNILGFGYVGYKVDEYSIDGYNTTRILNWIHCSGNEVDLASCDRSTWRSYTNYGSGTGVICRNYEVTDIRLVGGSLPYEGRIEVLGDGVWGTVCDDSWDLEDGHVICRMLGYEKAEVTYRYAHFGEGTGNINVDDLECEGNETSIEQCRFVKGEGHNCGHSEDASVKCYVVKRCAYQWMIPNTSKFAMEKTTLSQSNYTEIETTPASSDMRCIRHCAKQARANCGDPNECSLVVYDGGDCTLYHADNVTSSIICGGAIGCFKNMDLA